MPTRCCDSTCCIAWFFRSRPFSSSPSTSGASARTAACTPNSRQPLRKAPPRSAMDETKPFVASVESDARKAPLRIAFVTRRTSPQVKATDDAFVMTWPEGILRAAVVAEALAIVLVLISLFWDAPLEGLANPMQTPNPAKAPWYFLGLQELLHYFPPVVAGVLIPTLVIIALVIIPYFNVNIEAEGIWLRDRS